MIKFICTLFILIFAGSAFSQPELQPLLDTQRKFEKMVADDGMRAAFLKFLGDDAIIFQPEAINGKQYWDANKDDPSLVLSRSTTYSDVAANGLLGYTTGNWRLYQKGKSEGLAKFGQYVTIWERRADGFRASLDITIAHEKLPFSETNQPSRGKQSRDINKRGRSPADSSMSFLRTSMSGARLGGAYEKFAADDVRLLRDNMPPIIGKKKVVVAMNDYLSIDFPKKVALFQAADVAYTWNPCQFDNSDEGYMKGNCLHIWKLRNKKWWIVLGVFAQVPTVNEPILKTRPKRRAK
ncbi:MAG: hypothetical protein ABI481_03155 [Pyrinomonadaceae bacterium]